MVTKSAEEPVPVKTIKTQVVWSLDLLGGMPKLVLGVPVKAPNLRVHGDGSILLDPWDHYQFKKDSGLLWRLIDHQTAGLACNHRVFWGTILTPTEAGARLIQAVLDSAEINLGAMGGVSLAAINRYEDLLKQHGVSCNHSYKFLEEAFYPIDCTKKTLNLLAVEGQKLPRELNELIDFSDDSGSRYSRDLLWHNWSLWILDQNSD